MSSDVAYLLGEPSPPRRAISTLSCFSVSIWTTNGSPGKKENVIGKKWTHRYIIVTSILEWSESLVWVYSIHISSKASVIIFGVVVGEGFWGPSMSLLEMTSFGVEMAAEIVWCYMVGYMHVRHKYWTEVAGEFSILNIDDGEYVRNLAHWGFNSRLMQVKTLGWINIVYESCHQDYFTLSVYLYYQ